MKKILFLLCFIAGLVHISAKTDSLLTEFQTDSVSVFLTEEIVLSDTLKTKQDTLQTPSKTEEAKCPKRKKFLGMCVLVDDRTRNMNPKYADRYPYAYQQRLLEAGCVDIENDSKEVAYRKVREAWAMYEDMLVCDSLKFDVPKGNLIKYGIARNFEDFIDDMTYTKVNFNRIDPGDGMTVLDYIKKHWDRHRGTESEIYYRNWYEKFQKAGAKHRSELEQGK